MIKAWLNHAPLLGSIPQWLSAICTAGAFSLAVYGVNKAVPYFENLNLREANAQLQLANRTLEGRISDQRATLDANERSMRLAEMEKACSESRYVLSIIYISAYEAEARLNEGAASRRNFPAWDEAWEEMWKDAELSSLSLRYILKALMATNTLDNLPEEDREAVRVAWRNVEQAMGSGLDTEFIPKFRNREPIVSKSADELRTITASARDFAVALDRACGGVAANQK